MSSKQIFIFAYGSLMNSRSLEKTLPGPRLTHRATLKGYRRKMSVPFDGYAYLNIIQDESSSIAGVLIPVDDAEFALFTAREKGYIRTDVTDGLAEAIDGRAYAFIAPDSTCALKVPRSYINTCTADMTETERNDWIQETVMGEIEEDMASPVYEFHA